MTIALAVVCAWFSTFSAGAAAPTKPRTAFNLCDNAWLFVWPSDSSIPTRAHFPPSHPGERFEIIRGPVYTLGGKGYYETTVVVGYPWGLHSGGGTRPNYYWISDQCVNPPPVRDATK